ncbi:unnamed protein product [Clonostachys solani]|uniref:Uncharacterized protein n=1 Tax=Clonostachys solani TaxID=160281 RepID=A0A9P0EE90_9HYPO|nr:unnamed protein product [Clonostachys solani]
MNGRPWCAICRVDFKIGQKVAIPWLGPNNLGLFTFVYPGPKLEHPKPQNEDDNAPAPAPAPAEEALQYSASRWDDIPIDESFHEECLRGIGANTLRNLLYQTAYSYVPLPEEFERRLDWLKTEFSEQSAALYPLPAEMRREVVTYSLPSLTTVYIRSTGGGPHGRTQLSLTRPIWAQRIAFEGRLYISALTNEPPVTENTGARPNDMVKIENPEGPLAAIHIAMDHLGIRRVVLTNNGEVDPADYPVDTSIGGWVSLPFSGQTRIQCEGDGLKLRRLLYNGIDETLWSTLWPVPQSQPSNLRLWSMDERAFQVPMKYLHLNKPNLRGYSICWFYELMTICPHYFGGDKPNYEAWDIDRPKCIWAFLPIDPGETIVELWTAEINDTTVLVLTTSHGRILTLGVRPRTGNGKEWVLQDRFEGERTLLAEESWSGLARIAFPTAQPTQQQTHPNILPPVEYPDCKRDLWYSSTKLAGVVSMRICQKGGAVIGLLLSYEDGRERALGEVRFDSSYLGPEIETKGTRGVVYQLSKKKKKGKGKEKEIAVELHKETVVELHTSDREETEFSLESEETRRYFVPWRGTWHWWFSYEECRLFHEDEHDVSIVEDM